MISVVVPKAGMMTRSSGPSVLKGTSVSPVVVRRKRTPRAMQVRVDVRVVDHLREEEDPAGRRLVGVLVEGAVGDLDGVLDAEAEAEVAREVHAQRPEVQHARLRSRLRGSAARRASLTRDTTGLR